MPHNEQNGRKNDRESSRGTGKQNRRRNSSQKWLGVCAVIVALLGIAAAAAIYFYPVNGMDGAGQKPSQGGLAAEDADHQGASSQTNGSQDTDDQGADNQADGSQGTGNGNQETETQEPEVVEITISAVGDLTFGRNQKASYEGSFDEYYDDYGVDYFLQNVVDVFAQDDCTIGNLEGALTNSTDIRKTKEWNMKGRPEYVDILTRGSVEVVSLGNNHIMDYNEEGVADTINTLENAGVTYAISSVWGDKYGMYETSKGIRIGFVSVNEYYEGSGVYTYLEDGLNQPFLFHHNTGDFSIAHNGNIVNSQQLRRYLEDRGTLFQSSSDSEILAHLIRKCSVGEGRFEESSLPEAINRGASDEECAEIIAQYVRIHGDVSSGLKKRRWLEGAIYCGYITANDIRKLKPAAVYSCSLAKLYRHGVPDYRQSTISNFLKEARAREYYS